MTSHQAGSRIGFCEHEHVFERLLFLSTGIFALHTIALTSLLGQPYGGNRRQSPVHACRKLDK
jgi:hypothetical protein